MRLFWCRWIGSSLAVQVRGVRLQFMLRFRWSQTWRLHWDVQLAPIPDRIEVIATYRSEHCTVPEIRKILNTGSDQSIALRSLTYLSEAPPLQTPVFLSHSENDAVILIGNDRTLCKTLDALGFSVRWKNYGEGGHWVK